MKQTRSTLKHRTQKGQGLVEYAILLALVAVAAIVAVNLFGDGLTNTFSSFVGEGDFAPPDIGPLGGNFTPLPPTETPLVTNTPTATATTDPLATPTFTPTPSHTPTPSNTPTETPDPSIPTNTPTPCPYGPYAVPGRIEMENFDCGGQDTGYNDSDTDNTGGQYRPDEGVDIDTTSDGDGNFHIGWTLPGEWVSYKVNITNSAVYNLYLRFSSTSSVGRVRVYVDGNDVSGLVNIPNTGGFDNWATVEVPNIGLSSGSRTVRIVFENGAVNYNYFELLEASVPTFTPTPSQTPTNTPTFTPTPTATDTPVPSPTTSPTPGAGNVLLVVGSTSLNSGDQFVENRLEELGYTVTVVDDGASQTSDANGKILVVISSTSNSGSVDTKFRDVEVPVINWEQALQDELKMSDNNNGTDDGETEIDIVGAGHPMAAGLSNGIVTVSSSTTFSYGRARDTAAIIATLDNDNDRHVIYGYDTCALMEDDFEAPARRVMFFFENDTASNINGTGLSLFDAAVSWAINGTTGCGGPTPTPTATHTPVPVCYTVTASASPDAGGSVTLDPAGDCGPNSYSEGTDVTLTANANADYQFLNWSGDASGTTNPLTLTVDGDKSITANFESTCTLPSPWQNGDIGNVNAEGSACEEGGTFTVEGSGADIWNTADELHYVYQQLSGDFRITAQVTSQTDTNAWAKAGVMIRETLDADSRHALALISPDNGVRLQYRANTGGNSSYVDGPDDDPPLWLRLERSGDTFTAYHSSDGSNWTEYASATINMGNNVYYGLAVTSHNDGTLSTVTFTDVEIASLDPTPQLEVLTVNNVGTDSWTSVSLQSTYSDMVAVCTLQYNSSMSDPAVVRMRNASGNSFDIRIQNPGDSQTINGVTVHCMAMEAGAWTLSDGTNVEAQKYTSTVTDSKGDWNGEAQSYLQSYTTPIVLGQVMSDNDTDWSVFWSRGNNSNNPPNASNLRTGKHVGEDGDTTRADELIGFIVVEAGHSTIGGFEFEAGQSDDNVRGISNGAPFTSSFDTAFGSAPQVGIATQGAMDGGDGSWSFLYGDSPLSTTEIDLSADEDDIGDSERNHATEEVFYWVFSSAGLIE